MTDTFNRAAQMEKEERETHTMHKAIQPLKAFLLHFSFYLSVLKQTMLIYYKAPKTVKCFALSLWNKLIIRRQTRQKETNDENTIKLEKKKIVNVCGIKMDNIKAGL